MTPPRHAERVAKALGPKARSVVVANNGHNVTAIAVHARRRLPLHRRRPPTPRRQAVDMDCAAKVPRPLAFEPPLPARARPADNDPEAIRRLGAATSPDAAAAGHRKESR